MDRSFEFIKPLDCITGYMNKRHNIRDQPEDVHNVKIVAKEEEWLPREAGNQKRTPLGQCQSAEFRICSYAAKLLHDMGVGRQASCMTRILGVTLAKAHTCCSLACKETTRGFLSHLILATPPACAHISCFNVMRQGKDSLLPLKNSGKHIRSIDPRTSEKNNDVRKRLKQPHELRPHPTLKQFGISQRRTSHQMRTASSRVEVQQLLDYICRGQVDSNAA